MQSPTKNEMKNATYVEQEDDEYWPLSGKPYFNVFLTKSHLKPMYQMTIPDHMKPSLPDARGPAVLTYRGNNWALTFYGDANPKRFGRGWKHFAEDNDLKVGDACLFELVDFVDGVLKLRVQILRDDFPEELLEKPGGVSNGVTADSPICIDE